MEVNKQEWDRLREDCRIAREKAEEASLKAGKLLSDRGHTFIIFALVLLLMRGC